MSIVWNMIMYSIEFSVRQVVPTNIQQFSSVPWLFSVSFRMFWDGNNCEMKVKVLPSKRSRSAWKQLRMTSLISSNSMCVWFHQNQIEAVYSLNSNETLHFDENNWWQTLQRCYSTLNMVWKKNYPEEASEISIC